MNISPHTEFIYNCETCYNIDSIGYHSIKRFSIVNRVEKITEGLYHFCLKDGTTQYTSSYSWAFIENTEHNRNLLKRYLEIDPNDAKLSEERKNIFREMSTLWKPKWN